MLSGSADLVETYRNVLRADQERPSVAMIDLSIKLDDFPSYPLGEVEQLASVLKATASPTVSYETSS